MRNGSLVLSVSAFCLGQVFAVSNSPTAAKSEELQQNSEDKGKVQSSASDSSISTELGEPRHDSEGSKKELPSVSAPSVSAKAEESRQDNEDKGKVQSSASDSSISTEPEEPRHDSEGSKKELPSVSDSSVSAKAEESRQDSEDKGKVQSSASDSSISTEPGEPRHDSEGSKKELPSVSDSSVSAKAEESRQDSEDKGKVQSSASDSSISTEPGEPRHDSEGFKKELPSVSDSSVSVKAEESRQDSEDKGKVQSSASSALAKSEELQEGEDHGKDLLAWIRDMQDYLIELNLSSIPNLSFLIFDLEKAEKNCPKSQQQAISSVLSKLKELSKVVQQKPETYRGSVQTLLRQVKNIRKNLPSLRRYAKACEDNGRYKMFVECDLDGFITELEQLLSDRNICAELDDALTINDEKGLADFVIHSIEDLNESDLSNKGDILKIAESIVQHDREKGSYIDLFRQVIKLTYLYNNIAPYHNLSILRVSHVRDVRDAIVDRFLDEAAQKSPKDLGNMLIELRKKYDNNTLKSDILNEAANLLGEANLGDLAWRASQLYQAVSIVNVEVEKLKEVYVKKTQYFSDSKDSK